MAKITLSFPAGPQQVEGRRFSHYVGNVRYWFGYHKSLDRGAQYQVTHLDSGKRVCVVPYSAVAAARGDEILAARGEIDKLCQKHGAARVQSVLRQAEVEAGAA